MLIPIALLIAALVCFIVAAITAPSTPNSRYGWAGLAFLMIYMIMGAAKLT